MSLIGTPEGSRINSRISGVLVEQHHSQEAASQINLPILSAGQSLREHATDLSRQLIAAARQRHP
jgi:hypothetical protein